MGALLGAYPRRAAFCQGHGMGSRRRVEHAPSLHNLSRAPGPPRWGRVLGFSGVWTEWKKARCDSKVVRGNLGKEQEVGDL